MFAFNSRRHIFLQIHWFLLFHFQFCWWHSCQRQKVSRFSFSNFHSTVPFWQPSFLVAGQFRYMKMSIWHRLEKQHSEKSERNLPHLGVFHLALTINHNVGTRMFDDNLTSRNNYIWRRHQHIIRTSNYFDLLLLLWQIWTPYHGGRGSF